MWKKISILLFSICFPAVNEGSDFNLTYLDEQNLLVVESNIESYALTEELNNRFNIGIEDLIDLGLTPFSTLYMIDLQKTYTLEYNIVSSHNLYNVNIDLDNDLLGDNFSISTPMSMRGVNLAQINFYPIIYDPLNKIMTIIEQVEITINEQPLDDIEISSHVAPISREFEKLFSTMVVNLEIDDRINDDLPTILYICGGSSSSNSYLQDLMQWRREQGYKVSSVNTSEIGSDFYSIKEYISDAYYNWEYPPEYIVLVGDTSGSYQIGYSTASGGDSDYPYTLIDGDDLLPEMFIGRISASSSSDLSNIINKTLAYEKATFLEYTGADWYESSALVGDPSATGNSAIITNEYIENMLNAYDFDDVATCYGCSYSSWMQNQLEDGILYFNYRGYIGTSGFGSSHINNANNSYMTPFVTFITCSTGSFSGTSIIESFIRAGSTNNPKGGVAAIGTATSSTHTVPNNIVDMGIYDGIFAKDILTAGGALVSGKLSLFNTYPQNPSNMVYKFTYWNNLMGDPVLALWTDTPKEMVVEYPQIINMGTNSISLHVSDVNSNPVADARVTLFLDENNVYYSYTDLNGDAQIVIESEISSTATVTVLKRNFIPFSNSISISNPQMHIELGELLFYIDDSNSSNTDPSNGIANPGEIVDMYIYLENFSSEIIENLDASIMTNSEKLDILQGDFQIDYLNPLTHTIVGPVTLYLHEDITSGDYTDLTLVVLNDNDGLGDWNFNIPFSIIAPNISIENASTDQVVYPGDTANLFLIFENYGQNELNDSYAKINISNSLIDFVEDEVFIGDISTGNSLINESPFVLELSNDIIDGTVFNFDVEVYNDDGYSQYIIFNLIVGVANEHDPLGPDAYGYYIYDSTDLGYSLTPFYDWIEIDPSQGGNGISCGISDGGNGNNISNSTQYVDLPFIFTFYGEDYDEISVNANGWISFGHSNMESFRNYQLPGAGGPSPMIAAFWDDLKTNSSSEVFKYVDEDYVIIEWSEMRTHQHNDLETFQVILYNSMTPSGDDEIKIQYKEFNNTTNGDYAQYTPYHGCYSSIGIENHLGNIGLEYTFDNSYPIAASPLQDQSAIFITTRNTTVLTPGDVNQDEAINILDIILVINHILVIEELDSLGQFVADMDNNETINILDVIIMINLILDS